jgi:hypothetical protein
MFEKVNHLIRVTLILGLAAFLVSQIGCDKTPDNLGLVSGIVTMDGEPLANAEVYFYPEPTRFTANVGPFSVGLTDDQGKFELKTRYGDAGAVVGRHIVCIQYLGFDPMIEDELMTTIQEARLDNDENTAAIARAKLETAKARNRIPAVYDQNSKLRAKVSAEKNSLTFELESKPVD